MHFDLILMDLQMPEMDGYTAAKMIRKTDKGRRIPIIAMSAAVMQADKERVIASGMNDHVPKPVDIRKLTETLGEYLSDKRVLQAQGEQVGEGEKHNFVNAVRDAGLDVESALRKLDGNVGLYEKLMQSFLSDHKSTPQKLLDLAKQESTEPLQRLVHTVKGLAGTLGMDDLEYQAIELQGQITVKRMANVPEFSRLVGVKLDLIEAILGVHQRENRFRDLTSVHNAIEHSYQAIETLSEALRESRFTTTEDALRLLENMGRLLTPEQKEKCLDAIDNLEYQRALNILESVLHDK
jgi:HPt (histidine-containing phosphotransfer) domain-containing protein